MYVYLDLNTMQFHYSNMGKACYSLISEVEKLSKEKEALYSLNSKLKKLSKAKSGCQIYRVHQHLRNVNRGAYEPEIISIGPYHRGKGHLKMMENHKLLNLQSLVKRRKLKADEYAKAVSGEASLKALRKCYADKDFHLDYKQFIEMLVLDGCFIVELVRKYADRGLGKNGNDPILRMEWMITSLRRDLMLFENQIPFFVLCILFDLIKDCNETRTLLELLTIFFRNLYPGGKGHSGEVLLQVDNDHKIKHLLHLIHRNWVDPRLQQLNEKENVTIDSMPVLERKETDFTLDMFLKESDVEMGSGTPLQDEENENEVEMGSEIFINHATELQQLNSKKKDEERQKPNRFCWMCCKTDVESGNENENEHQQLNSMKKDEENSLFINHATELTEANVEFKKEENKTLLFDVNFKDGVMVMPPLSIEDGTECFLRNLIVYEQYFQHQLRHTVVTDYMMLLDNLIDSAKDVEILSRQGIIKNWQGDDEVVAKMVNRLGDLVIYNCRNFSYATMFEEVNEHCRKPWNRWLAKLRRDYLNSPWGIISIIAAVVLLLLTVTQTLLSVLQVVQEN